jgi:hypothetical protein
MGAITDCGDGSLGIGAATPDSYETADIAWIAERG